MFGTHDVPLSAEGRRQLGRLAGWAASVARPDALYASPLQRARETAEVCAQVWNLAATPESSLREIHCGAMDGRRIIDIQKEHPEVWASNVAQEDDAFRWPGGESYAEFRGRILGALTRLAERHRGQTVAVVTHAGVVTQVIGSLRGRRAAQWEADRPEPLSVTELLWDGANPLELVTFNAPVGTPEAAQRRG